ncbi:barstar family protein [Streptomyces sp. NPDC094149]|uniref:barstar family protein n=1 Tax=Streptomyces sp. NPDC094149 TaxID=3155079 RepID=UPI0033337F81
MNRFFSENARDFHPPMFVESCQVKDLVTEAKRRNLGVFLLDGARMTNQASLFGEFQEKLQFPEYFGKNWNALDECLADLDWLDERGFLLVIESGNSLLCDEDEEVRGMFGSLLTDIAQEWAESDSPVLFRTIVVVDR